MRYRLLAGFCMVPCFAVTLACSGDSSNSEDSDSSDTSDTSVASTSTTSTGTLATGSDIEDVKLSDSLNVDAPQSVSGTGDEVTTTEAGTISVSLTDRLKSEEACHLREKVREKVNTLKDVAAVICDVEKISEGLGFGGKWEALADEDGDGVKETGWQFWADDSKEDEVLTLHLCRDSQPLLRVVVTGANGTAAKGNFKFIDAGDDRVVSITGTFDNKFTNSERVKLNTQSYFKDGDAAEVREIAALNLHQTKLSEVRLASRGFTLQQGEPVHFEILGAGRYSKRLGNILAAHKFGAKGVEAERAYRAYFDGRGNILSQGDSPAFADESDLIVPLSSVPLPLADTFQVPALKEDAGWDCTGTSPIASWPEEDDLALCKAIRDSKNETAENCDDESLYTEGTEVLFEKTQLDSEVNESELQDFETTEVE